MSGSLSVTRAAACEAVWQWIIGWLQDRDWDADVDMAELLIEANDLGLVRREPYDPVRHGDLDAEPGDLIYIPVREDEGTP